MVNLKFGRNIKNAFRRQDGKSSVSVAVNGKSKLSIESDTDRTSSLNTDAQTHGPNVDTSRNAKFEELRPGGHDGGTGLVKIEEGVSIQSSPCNTPDTTAGGRPSTPSDQPIMNTANNEPHNSPGAISVSTIDGRDVFERSLDRSFLPLTAAACKPAQSAMVNNAEKELQAFAVSSPARTKKDPKISKASPTSVIHLSGSAYPVEVDPADSLDNERIDKYSIVEPDKYNLESQSDQDYAKLLLGPEFKQFMNNASPSQSAAITSMSTPPKITRISPTKIFNEACRSFKSTSVWDSSNYTNLEDAVAAHAAMLTNTNGGVITDAADVKKHTKSEHDAASVLTSSSDKKNEFLALKKGAEKNEFKKKTQEKTQENMDVARRQPLKPLSKNNPHGIYQTNTRSVSPSPASSNPFVDYFIVLPKAPSSITPHQPQPEPTQLQLDAGAVVTNMPSVSLDQLFESHSDDSCSFFSDIESIGEITICEETAVLIEARCAYENDAKTNASHPSRSKASIMKVGSQLPDIIAASQLEVQLKHVGKRLPSVDDTMLLSVDGSMKTDSSKNTEMGRSRLIKTDIIAASASIYTEQPRRLTWYDDEENWYKPFTLRTDETFDGTTIASDRSQVTRMKKAVRYNVVDQFLGDFIKGISKYTACGAEDDVISFDVAEQQEI